MPNCRHFGQLGTACTKPAKISDTNYKITALERLKDTKGKKRSLAAMRGNSCSQPVVRGKVVRFTGGSNCCSTGQNVRGANSERVLSHRRELVGQKFAIVLSIVYGSNRWLETVEHARLLNGWKDWKNGGISKNFHSYLWDIQYRHTICRFEYVEYD